MKFPIDIKMTTSALVTTTAVIALGIYDLIAVFFAGNESISISRFLINISFNAPAVVFMVGFVCGHVFSYPRLIKPSELPCEDKDG